MKVYIKQRRKFLDMSQGRLAREVNMDYTAISRIERGRLMPTVPYAIKIAKALHCPVEILWIPEDSDT